MGLRRVIQVNPRAVGGGLACLNLALPRRQHHSLFAQHWPRPPGLGQEPLRSLFGVFRRLGRLFLQVSVRGRWAFQAASRASPTIVDIAKTRLLFFGRSFFLAPQVLTV